MIKVLLTAIMLVGLAFSSEAQTFSKNSIGLRLGDNDGFGGEISYQRALSSNNRLELDLGYKIINTNDISWSIDANFTKVKNEVTDLASDNLSFIS